MPPLLVCPKEDWFCHLCVMPGELELKSAKKVRGSKGSYKKKVKKEEEEEEVDDVVCQICNSGDNEETILLCDECDRGKCLTFTLLILC
jgi:ribose 1,5-bisphosphokinase PhnN